jgi:hypothetical protein
MSSGHGNAPVDKQPPRNADRARKGEEFPGGMTSRREASQSKDIRYASGNRTATYNRGVRRMRNAYNKGRLSTVPQGFRPTLTLLALRYWGNTLLRATAHQSTGPLAQPSGRIQHGAQLGMQGHPYRSDNPPCNPASLQRLAAGAREV